MSPQLAEDPRQQHAVPSGRSNVERNQRQTQMRVRKAVRTRPRLPTTPDPPPLKNKRKPFKVGQEVYVLRESGVTERGWVIIDCGDDDWYVESQVHVRTANGKYVPMRLPYNPERIAHVHEIEEADRNPNRMSFPKAMEAEVRKFRILEKNTEGMIGRQEFHQLFKGNLRQANVGNCYLCAAFYSLQQSPHLEAIMRTSIQRLKPPSPRGYVVAFPLGSLQKTMWVPVYTSDLEPQVIESTEKGKARRVLKPIDSSNGWKIMEAAFSKLKTRKSQVDRASLEGGSGHNALCELFGDNVMKYILGKFSMNTFSTMDSEKQQELEKWLNRFNPRKDIATVHGKGKKKNSAGRLEGSATYVAQKRSGPVTLYYNHAYSISTVNKADRTVHVHNPHDTSKRLIFTYEQFFEAFTQLSGVELNMNALFR